MPRQGATGETRGHRRGRRPLPAQCRMTAHSPVTRAWTCNGCGLPWPCPTRKQELQAEYDRAPVSLALYLGAHLVQATEDMPWTPAGILHRRFLGWTRSRAVHVSGTRENLSAVDLRSGRVAATRR